VPRLCDVYPGIYLTTEEKAGKNLSQCSRRMPVGKEYTITTDIFSNLEFCRILGSYVRDVTESRT